MTEAERTDYSIGAIKMRVELAVFQNEEDRDLLTELIAQLETDLEDERKRAHEWCDMGEDL